MNHLAYCVVAAAIGFPLGYYLPWAWDQANAWFEKYLDGASEVYWLEVWR